MSALSPRELERLRSPLPEPGPGDLLDGRYELEGLLGEGGMGVVFAARDLADGEAAVAIKIVRIEDDASAARFAREEEILGALRHDAVVRFRGSGSAPRARRRRGRPRRGDRNPRRRASHNSDR